MVNEMVGGPESGARSEDRRSFSYYSELDSMADLAEH